MTAGVDIVNIARTQLGFVEGPNNESPYGTWYGEPNQPYCAMGVSWCFRSEEHTSELQSH